MGALRAPPVGTQDRDALSRLRGWPFPIPIVGAAPRGALRSARRHATAPARHACSCSAGVSAASLPSGGQDGRYGRGHLGQRVHPRPRGPRGHPARGRQRCEILQSVCGAWCRHGSCGRRGESRLWRARVLYTRGPPGSTVSTSIGLEEVSSPYPDLAIAEFPFFRYFW